MLTERDQRRLTLLTAGLEADISTKERPAPLNLGGVNEPVCGQLAENTIITVTCDPRSNPRLGHSLQFCTRCSSQHLFTLLVRLPLSVISEPCPGHVRITSVQAQKRHQALEAEINLPSSLSTAVQYTYSLGEKIARDLSIASSFGVFFCPLVTGYRSLHHYINETQLVSRFILRLVTIRRRVDDDTTGSDIQTINEISTEAWRMTVYIS